MKRLLLLFTLFILLAASAMAQDIPINWHRMLCQQARDTFDMYRSIVEETKDLYAIQESADTSLEENLGFVKKVSYMAALQRTTGYFLDNVVMDEDPFQDAYDGKTWLEIWWGHLTDDRKNARISAFDDDVRHPAVERAFDLVILNSHLVELLWDYRSILEFHSRNSVCTTLFPIDSD